MSIYLFLDCICLKVPTNSLGDFELPRSKRAVESAALWKGEHFPQGLDNSTSYPHFPQPLLLWLRPRANTGKGGYRLALSSCQALMALFRRAEFLIVLITCAPAEIRTRSDSTGDKIPTKLF
jgi:hypothetical protein